MQVRKSLAIVGAGVVLVAAAPTFAGATGTIKDVLVTNKGEEQAIPTKATGVTPVSGTVAVGNLPSTQQVAGSVAVTNLPGVQTVQDADAPHLRPFIGGTGGNDTVTIPDNQFGASHTFDAPANKRFVAQHISGAIQLPAGQVPQLTAIRVGPVGQPGRSIEVLAQQISSTPENQWKFSHPLTLYAEPGDEVELRVNRFPNKSGVGNFRWSIVGYLVDP